MPAGAPRIIVFLSTDRVMGVVETEHRKQPRLWDEQAPAHTKDRHPREFPVSRHNLLGEVAADAEQLGRFRDREGGAHA